MMEVRRNEAQTCHVFHLGGEMMWWLEKVLKKKQKKFIKAMAFQENGWKDLKET